VAFVIAALPVAAMVVADSFGHECGHARYAGASGKRRRAYRSRQARRGEFLLWLMLALVIFEEVAPVVAGRDYYDILGVARDADSSSIKRAFRKLAKEHHPDKNKGDKTSERLYVELNTAYEVLSDSSKRQRYDMYGEAGVKDGMQHAESDNDGWGFDLEAMFGGGGRRQQQEEKRGPSIVVPLSVSLEMLYNGGIIEASHKRRIQCSSWSDCESKCAQCGGSGVVVTTRRIGPGFVQQVRHSCPKCSGTGKISNPNCQSCPSGQFEQVEKPLLIDIERGFKDGHHILFEGQSDEIPDHATGHVNFEVDTLPHAAFERRGNDLHYDLTVTLTEALVGIDRAVRQLDGRIVPIRTTAVTEPQQTIRIAGEGMPVFDESGTAGDMVVHVWVQFPKTISKEQKHAIIKLHGAPPPTEIGNGGGAHSGSPASEPDEDRFHAKEEL
jgi:DnaJ-related protein SCJ1